MIGGAMLSIPSGGVDLNDNGLTSATTYFVYAFASATSVVTLEATTSTHATATSAGTVGVEIKSGDSSRTLVGRVRLNSNGLFVDSVTQRFLVNWFNRRDRLGEAVFSTSRTTTSLTLVEINSEIRIEFLTWGDEGVLVVSNQSVENNTLLASTITNIGLDDGTTSRTFRQDFQAAVAATRGSGTSGGYMTMSEGYHFVTVAGFVTSGTGTWTGDGSVLGNLHVGLRI